VEDRFGDLGGGDTHLTRHPNYHQEGSPPPSIAKPSVSRPKRGLGYSPLGDINCVIEKSVGCRSANSTDPEPLKMCAKPYRALNGDLGGLVLPTALAKVMRHPHVPPMSN
jgi:hypothetical protein